MNSRQSLSWLIVFIAGPLWLSLPAITIANEFSWSEVPGTGSAPAGQAGDYNNDGVVNAHDYVLWRKYKDTTYALPNDPNGGTIGVAQFILWRANYGKPTGSGLVNTGIPEPTSAILLLIGTITVALLRRSRPFYRA